MSGVSRRFHTLLDKVPRRDVLWRAWVELWRNDGAQGIDKSTWEQIEQACGSDWLLGELAVALRDGTYRPMPTRRSWIAQPGRCDQPSLSISAVRDRIEQSARSIMLEPSLTARFCRLLVRVPPQAGPARCALQVLVDEAWQSGGGWSKPMSAVVRHSVTDNP